MKQLKLCTTKAMSDQYDELTSLSDWYNAPVYYSGGLVVINHPYILQDRQDFQASYTQFIAHRTKKIADRTSKK